MTNSFLDKYNGQYDFPVPGSNVGYARKSIGRTPIYGLRHPVKGLSNGWFWWHGSGIDTGDNSYFEPICLEHFIKLLPITERYLSLPPGYRILIDLNGYEDVWYDSLLIDGIV